MKKQKTKRFQGILLSSYAPTNNTGGQYNELVNRFGSLMTGSSSTTKPSSSFGSFLPPTNVHAQSQEEGRNVHGSVTPSDLPLHQSVERAWNERMQNTTNIPTSYGPR